jgi:hypothetical protein
MSLLLVFSVGFMRVVSLTYVLAKTQRRLPMLVNDRLHGGSVPNSEPSTSRSLDAPSTGLHSLVRLDSACGSPRPLWLHLALLGSGLKAHRHDKVFFILSPQSKPKNHPAKVTG